MTDDHGNPENLPDYDLSDVGEVERKKRQVNGRPVNIFGLAFGSNQSPQDRPAEQVNPPPAPLSNADVTFDENSFDAIIQNAMR